MLKACPFCGRIHPRGYECPHKPRRWNVKRDSPADKFRKTWAWQQKRELILKRDYNLCRICNEGSYGDYSRVNRMQDKQLPLQVHHIEPLEECYERRLDEDNLITVCGQHHEMAEAGKIPREYLHQLTQVSPRWGAFSGESDAQDRQLAREGKEV